MLYSQAYRRAHRRNPVINKALTPRPTLESMRAKNAACPICGALNDHLTLELRAPVRRQPFVLTFLRLRQPRWLRNQVTISCDSCDCSFAGGAELNWNAAVSRRRYADLGMTSMPPPATKMRRQSRTFRETVLAALRPAKRRMVERQALKIRKLPRRHRITD